MNENILMAAICPHPPIIIPEVGRSQTEKVEKTILALQTLSNNIVEANPETIVIITPHSDFDRNHFNTYADKVLEGSFVNFGAPEAKFMFENDIKFIESLASECEEYGLNEISSKTPLDHGSGVPLYFLAKAGYKGKIVVINYAAFGPEEHILFGEKIRETANKLDKKIVFIASGDLSHKLIPSAPAGYDPEAHFF